MKSISDALVGGIWGPNSKFGNNLNYGGPDCAAEASIEFKLAFMLVMIPYQAWFVKVGWKATSEEF